MMFFVVVLFRPDRDRVPEYATPHYYYYYWCVCVRVRACIETSAMRDTPIN